MTELKITAANFENEVLHSDKPVLLDFYADWCGPCKMLSPILHELAEEKSGVLKVGKVNVDEQMELAMRFQVSSIPMLVVFKDGKVVTKGGVNVSGGQKQRLCIARAILKKPKVLILDDSTSAVDTATDAKIRQAFRQDLPGTTKLIVAQRVTSVMDADLILVMDDGAVAAQGTHEELMKTCEIYREVYESQQEGVSIGG